MKYLCSHATYGVSLHEELWSTYVIMPHMECFFSWTIMEYLKYSEANHAVHYSTFLLLYRLIFFSQIKSILKFRVWSVFLETRFGSGEMAWSIYLIEASQYRTLYTLVQLMGYTIFITLILTKKKHLYTIFITLFLTKRTLDWYSFNGFFLVWIFFLFSWVHQNSTRKTYPQVNKYYGLAIYIKVLRLPIKARIKSKYSKKMASMFWLGINNYILDG